MTHITIGAEKVSLEKPVVMGILNVTPDSFYDGGKYTSELKIMERVDEIVEQGAGIIDVGAYSTRQGAAFVDTQEELSRLSFALELIRKYHPHLPVSIDTFRADVAKEISHCLGSVIINDISGGTMDDKMFETVAELGLPYIMMHILGTPQDMQVNPHYDDVVREVREFFTERITRLNALGFNNIILDQGFGFGKTVAHNYELLYPAPSAASALTATKRRFWTPSPPPSGTLSPPTMPRRWPASAYLPPARSTAAAAWWPAPAATFPGWFTSSTRS